MSDTAKPTKLANAYDWANHKDELREAIEREVDGFISETGEVPPNFAIGLAERFSDDCGIVRENWNDDDVDPIYPAWLLVMCEEAVKKIVTNHPALKEREPG